MQSSPLDVEYVDSEFTELDVSREVQSPTDKAASRSKGIFSLVSSRNGRKATPLVQDPTFKDFTYFCEDPDALVEVKDLVSELRPPPAAPSPSPTPSETDDDVEPDIPIPPTDHPGTPLSSFVEHGVLHSEVSDDDFRLEMKKLGSTMAEQFERVEVTISRERPAHLSAKASPDQTVEETAAVSVTTVSVETQEDPVSVATTATTSSVSVTYSSRSHDSRQESSASSSDGPLTMD